MTKIEQLQAYLRKYSSTYRSKHGLGDETLMFTFSADNKIRRVWVGAAEPANDKLKVDDLWFNNQVLRHCVGIGPNAYKVVTTYYKDATMGYGVFSTQIVNIGEDFGRTTVANVEIIGPEKLDPASPDASKGTYKFRLTMSDGEKRFVKPTWTVTDLAPVTIKRSDKDVIVTAQAVTNDTAFVLQARYQDPEFGTLSAMKNVVIIGSKPVVLTQIEIVGPDEVTSNATNVRYTLRQYFSDGTVSDTEVNGYWSLSNQSYARFASGSREETGGHVLVNMLNHAFDAVVILTAKVVVNCSQILTASKHITIKANTGMQDNEIYPYYGKGPAGMRTANFILGLSGRGDNARRQNKFELELCEGEKGYYAYPVSYGQGTFVNLDNNFTGGWEGSPNAVAGDVYVPDIVAVPVGDSFIDFYIYESDYAGLGVIRTEVQ